MKQIHIFALLGLALLTACADPYPPTPRPDYTIRVTPSDHGLVAVPPPCPSWTTAVTDPYDNQPVPQFGCANARNLAMMVERPEDLVQGRELGPANGTHAVGSMLRYTNDQTRGLLWTGVDPNSIATTTSSTASSPISGEVSAPSSSSGSSSGSSSSAAAPAAAP
jgi:hypothetical protein